ncbi:MAG: COX15/CtaA family protein [Polyangiales bacterium]
MTEEPRGTETFRRAAWIYLAYVVGVIAWGAYVRVSFSGDGCGEHWPDCNGQIVPVHGSTKQAVEYAHRVTSGLAGLLAVAFVGYARRVFPRGHAVRAAAGWGLFFMITEALLGAALVKLRMVGSNTAVERGYWSAGHLCNTFALLFAITRMAIAAHGVGPFSVAGRRAVVVQLGGGFVALLVVGMTGAIAALGDTLFPAQSLGHGIVQDFDPSSHPFLQLRAFHPLFALGAATYLLYVAWTMAAQEADGRLLRASRAVIAIVVVQVALGFLNLALLAPTVLQIAHLVVADALWASLTVLASLALTSRPAA